MDLADRIIAQNKLEEKKKEYAPHFGIDETGIPVPKPVNASYVVMRILGNKELHQAGGEFYIHRQRYPKNSQSLIALCGRPKLVLFEDVSEDDLDSKHEVNEDLWKQLKNTIKSEHGLIWEMLKEMTPAFDKRYIRINKELVWDRRTSEIIMMPEDVL